MSKVHTCNVCLKYMPVKFEVYTHNIHLQHILVEFEVYTHNIRLQHILVEFDQSAYARQKELCLYKLTLLATD